MDELEIEDFAKDDPELSTEVILDAEDDLDDSDAAESAPEIGKFDSAEVADEEEINPNTLP